MGRLIDGKSKLPLLASVFSVMRQMRFLAEKQKSEERECVGVELSEKCRLEVGLIEICTHAFKVKWARDTSQTMNFELTLEERITPRLRELRQ